MTIYVSVPTLEDNEVTYTAIEAIEKADNPSEIFVGVSFTSSKKFYKDSVKRLAKYPNIKTKFFSNKDAKNIGVGIGRLHAQSMYNDEDYILQIDAHTHFEQGWDTTLINLFEEAKAEVKSDKLILSGFLTPYMHDPVKGRYHLDRKPMYPFFEPGFVPDTGVPLWSTVFINESPVATDRKFIPIPKIVACFIFGDRHFGVDSRIWREAIFMDEEITQSMNLLSDGFALVFPVVPLPMYHLYKDDSNLGVGTREDLGKYSDKIPAHGVGMTNNYYRFIEDPANREKVSLFQKYARIHAKHGSVVKWHIPKDYDPRNC